MAEIRITTPRGIGLAGTFLPADDDVPGAGWRAPAGAAVLFVHGFLADRSSRGRADSLGVAYRRAGFATLALDLSGCGLSDDDDITVASEVEDLAAAGAWLAAAGYPRQVVHAHSLGALVALRTPSEHTEAMVLTGPVTAPLHRSWDEVLSPEQMADLVRTGHTDVPDDGPSARQRLTISTQTLADFADVDQGQLLGSVACPVLVLHGGALVDGEEHALLTSSRLGLHHLAVGSRLEVVPGADHAMLDHSDEVAARALRWLAEQLRA